MSRIVTFLLLCSFGLASMLGHGGFHVLGLHSHCQNHSADGGIHSHVASQHSDHLSHHNHTHHVTGLSESESPCHHNNHQAPIHQDSSDACTICQFLSLSKADIVQPPTSHCFFATVFHKLVTSNDILLPFDFSLRPIPRGPPALFA